jgi:hypothetical protein
MCGIFNEKLVEQLGILLSVHLPEGGSASRRPGEETGTAQDPSAATPATGAHSGGFRV